jgi:hypothetical protein
MSLQDVIQNYWQTFFIAPLAFLSHKIFSLNSKVAVHDQQIKTLERGLANLCTKHDETNNLLREIKGALENHLRQPSPH